MPTPTPTPKPTYDPELAGMGRDALIEKIHKQDEYILHLRESFDRAEEKWQSNARYYASEREQRQKLQVEVKDLNAQLDERDLRVKALTQLESCDGSVSIIRGPSGEFRVRVLNGCSWQPGDPVKSTVLMAKMATPAIEDADLSIAILRAFHAGNRP